MKSVLRWPSVWIEARKQEKDIIGRPGGLARAKKLSAKRRSEIARNAANIRWSRRNEEK